ncbi:transglycosylase SLT domain-containing protein [Desulfococcus sp.]|uniref:transglycosylase SLT domain-containing protein n=1 Tax=Desulfococcus sp. TaxID=2025834 RepID=UPI003D13F4B9
MKENIIRRSLRKTAAILNIGFAPLMLILVLLNLPAKEIAPPSVLWEATTTMRFPEQVIYRVQRPFKGDLEELRKKRIIRALVSYSRTHFFIDNGVPRGFEYELLQNYEKYLNRNIRRRDRQIKLIYIPVPFERVLDALRDGRGDIAAAGLTIPTEDREKIAFSIPYIPEIHKVIVHHRAIDDIRIIEDLSDRKVHVLKGRGHLPCLRRLNRLFSREGLPPMQIAFPDGRLVTEDLLEFVNAGVMPVAVTDEHIARVWAEVLPNIIVRSDLTVNVGGSIAWAVRKENPQLLASIDSFLKDNSTGSFLGNLLFKRYYHDARWIKNPVSESAQKRLEEVMNLFRKYGDRYGFDWIAIAAQAYQESELDHRKRSHKGAVGIMQVMPHTASSRLIGIPDIHQLENNIHAGVKYLHHLRHHYFNDPAIPPAAQVDFSWAAYNAGPLKIIQLRKAAEKRGLDPNRWFLNVEQTAPRETVEYVANINKYYIAYKFYFQSMTDRGDLAMLRLEANTIAHELHNLPQTGAGHAPDSRNHRSWHLPMPQRPLKASSPGREPFFRERRNCES